MQCCNPDRIRNTLQERSQQEMSIEHRAQLCPQCMYITALWNVYKVC